MFMNKKLKALWGSVKVKIQFWKKSKTAPKSDIDLIADRVQESDRGECSVPYECDTFYGVHPGILGDFAIRRGGHVMQTAIYQTKDGRVIKYPNKIKRNDGSIETVTVITKEQAERLANNEERAREAAMGFPPRCPDCEAVLPEGTVLGKTNTTKEL